MIVRIILLSLILFLSQIGVCAQNIKVSLKQFPFEEYVLIAYQGTYTDTLAIGNLDMMGNAHINVSKDGPFPHKGMALFQLGDGQNFNLFIDTNDFSVTSDSDMIGLDNVVFQNSPENTAILRFVLRDEPIPTNFRYVNDFFKIIEYMNEISRFSNNSAYELESLRNKVFSLNIEVLYTTSLWRTLISYWVGLEQLVPNKDEQLVVDATKIMAGIKSEIVLDEFANNMVDISEQYGWEYVKENIVLSVYNMERIEFPTRHLASAIKGIGAMQGKPAPDFQLGNGKWLSDYSSQKILLFFYESGCNHCDTEVLELKNHFKTLNERGIRIISISSDSNITMFESNSNTFPWNNRLHDPLHKVFEEYGIIMTPVYLVIDTEGKIAGRYAKLTDTKLLD